MIEKSYLGLTIDGTPVYRIANTLYKEENGQFIRMEESEVEDFVLGQDEDDYPDEYYEKFEPVEHILGDTRLTY